MKKYLSGYITGLLTTLIISVFAVSEILSSNITYDNSSSGLNATNAQDAIDELYEKYSCSYDVNYVWNYSYKGYEEEFEIPCTGKYKIEVWGAQGGSTSNASGTSHIGGYGAYAAGSIDLDKKTILYINVGGKGTTNTGLSINAGGYNGGGDGQITDTSYSVYSASGGGATSVATKSGLLSTLSSSIDDIIIVGAGGGGANYDTSYNLTNGTGGNGGGIKGNSGTYIVTNNVISGTPAYGGTQTSGGAGATGGSSNGGSGSFGKGGTSGRNSGGGGAGFYGGGGGGTSGDDSSGAGGSGYIGNSKLTNKIMCCYNCTTSDDTSTKTISNTCVNGEPTENCSNIGNGYVRITYLGN